MLQLLPHLAASTSGDWSGLIGILLLLATALVLGTIAERLKQNAILGYLVAGTLIGPNVLGLIDSTGEVEIIAEIGVALLLFTVGLEISIKRLLRMGPIALLGGLLQVVITMAAMFVLSVGMGVDIKAAICLGAMLALSSTACVIRLLADNSAIDAVYGRSAVGILLFQDIAVMPLVLTVTMLSGSGDEGSGNAMWMLMQSLFYAGLMVLGFWVLMNHVVPHLLNIRQWAKNRELPILMAVVLAVGSAVIAHKLGISAAMGAFIAGILLAESPFATQVRADVGALRTVLVTLFFASIGMLAEPVWAAQNALLVISAATIILILKPAIIWFIARRFGFTHGQSLATGLCLAQVGEFSFVLAEVARGTAISEDIFRLVVASTIVTLFATPFLVRFAPTLGNRLQSHLDNRKRTREDAVAQCESPEEPSDADSPSEDVPKPAAPIANRILIIGFGPAGQCVAETLISKHREKILILDQNHRNAAAANRMGLAVQVGSGTSPETLEHAHIELTSVVVITIPDPHTVRQIIHACRSLNPNAKLIVRSRYHVYRWELMLTGATEVIDEEEQVGHRLAVAARRQLEPDAS